MSPTLPICSHKGERGALYDGPEDQELLLLTSESKPARGKQVLKSRNCFAGLTSVFFVLEKTYRPHTLALSVLVITHWKIDTWSPNTCIYVRRPNAVAWVCPML